MLCNGQIAAELHRREPLGNKHRCGTEWTGPGCFAGRLPRRLAGSRQGFADQFPAEGNPFGAVAVGQKAEVSDADESGRKNVQQKRRKNS